MKSRWFPLLDITCRDLCPWESDASTIACRVYLQSHNLIMALHDEPVLCFKPADCLVLGTHRHRRSSERSEIIALHSLSRGIVIEHVTLSHQSHSPVLHLLLLAFLPSLLHLLAYLRFCGQRVCNGSTANTRSDPSTNLRSSSLSMVVSRGLSDISTYCSTNCVKITGTIRFLCRGL